MSIDKRVAKRSNKRFQLRFGLEQPEKLGFTEDISDTGIFVRSPQVLHPGKILFVELKLKDGSTILFKGRIMWAKRVPQSLMNKIKGGMGVRILSFEHGEEEYQQLCSGLKK